MSLRGVQGLTYCIAFFIVITIIVCLQYLPFSTDEYDYPDELENVLEFQLSKVMGKPLEKVNVDYTRNIHFSVKTSVKNYRTRLSLLLLTWFQTVEKDQLFIISDNPRKDKQFIKVLRDSGYNLIPTSCKDAHNPIDLCCKTGQECGIYYTELEKHKDQKERYQWFCHFDDDVYVNVKQLSNLLQKYDHNEPYYIGRWPREARLKENSVKASEKTLNKMKKSNYPVHTKTYRYATGSTRCMSYGMMMKVAEFFNFTTKYCQVARKTDDMSQGAIVEIVMGYRLISVDEIHGQFEDISKASKDEVKKYITISYAGKPGQLFNHISIPSDFSNDEARFMAYHCLLYPEVSWCHNSN